MKLLRIVGFIATAIMWVIIGYNFYRADRLKKELDETDRQIKAQMSLFNKRYSTVPPWGES